MFLSRPQQASTVALIGLCLTLQACRVNESTVSDSNPASEAQQEESPPPEPVRSGQIWSPDEGDLLWFAPESPDNLGSGGEFHIYVDPQTHPYARASFSKFAIGVGGALPEHRHDKTEEIAYFISGQGLVHTNIDGEYLEVPIGPGYVWYNPPGAWHALTNTGDEPLTLVFTTVPNEEAGLLSFFRQVSARPGEEPVTLTSEEFGRIASEHDLILKPAAEQ